MSSMATMTIALNFVTQSLISVVPTFDNKDPMGTYPLGVITCKAFVPGWKSSGPFTFSSPTEGTEIQITSEVFGQPFTAGAYTVACEAVVHEPGNTVNGGILVVASDIPVTIPGAPASCTSGVSATPAGGSSSAVSIGASSIVDHQLDLGHTHYIHFPDALSAMDAHPFPRTVTAGTEVNLKCCAGEECTFAFALYRCEECTGPKPFGMAQQLLLDNWESASCSPKFDEEFGTTLFYKNVQGDYDRTFQLHHDELFVVLMKNGAPLPVPLCNKPHGPFPAGGARCGAKCPTL